MNMEIEAALWPRGARADQEMTALLQRYHAENKGVFRVRVHNMDAQNPWNDVSHTMSHRKTTDITELGASWVDGLVATHSLRPFSAQEFDTLGGAAAFALPPWTSKVGDTDVVYSIPYRADARLIFYRRDLLAQAGVDENTAFTTPQNVLQTLEKLKQHTHVKSPLVAPITTDRFINLSFAVSWAWSMGGDLVDPAGTQVTFDQPETLAGIADYLRAAGYIAPAFRNLEPNESDLAFCSGHAAVAFSGPWLFFELQENPAFAEISQHMAIALPPGQACNGGTHLVIWQHSQHHEAALDFVRFLTSPQVQGELSGSSFIMPACWTAIQASHYINDPNYQTIVKAIRTGRSYGNLPMWIVVEDRLSRLLTHIGQEYFETPPADLDAFLALRLKPLARRVNITLAS